MKQNNACLQTKKGTCVPFLKLVFCQVTMEGKKISFGFIKTKKLEKLPMQEKKDFIECVEEKSIKVVGGEEVKEIVPLIIPMKPNTLITTERLKEIADKVESAIEEPETVETSPKPQRAVPENETLEQMAVRELLEDSKKEVKVDTPQLTLLLPSKSVSSGEKESTLDDYESVPVQEFGLAMLRGMGWKKTTDKSTFKPPQLRPKGLGLGADKVVKDKQKVTKNSKDEELAIVKNAYIKITTGKYTGYYGKVLSLDDDNGRVMVDITVKKETVSLSEFMMHPVSKSEFDKESKVINADSFEKYKKNEGQVTSKNSETESSSREERNNRNEKHEREGNDNNNHKGMEKETQSDNKERNRERTNRERYRPSSDDKYRKNRDSSQESLSDSDSRKKHKKERRSKKQYSSMESLDSDTDRRCKKKERRRSSDSDSDRRKKIDKEHKRKDSDDLRGKKSDERKKHNSDIEFDRSSKKIEIERRYSSDSESDGRSSKKKEKDRRRHDSDSDQRKSKRSDTPEGKRDIDKKRKGKKKKRDRDRSPHYRKHRK